MYIYVYKNKNKYIYIYKGRHEKSRRLGLRNLCTHKHTYIYG